MPPEADTTQGRKAVLTGFGPRETGPRGAAAHGCGRLS